MTEDELNRLYDFQNDGETISKFVSNSTLNTISAINNCILKTIDLSVKVHNTKMKKDMKI